MTDSLIHARGSTRSALAINEALDGSLQRLLPASENGESIGGDAYRGARILIVDDDFEMRHMIVNYLMAQNVRAIPAQGRQEMVRQFAASEPSLVVLDLCLGEEDGLDLLRDIRSRSDVPVIITTGHRRDEIDVVLGLEFGADDYLAKPFGLRELVARIRAVLRRRAVNQVFSERDAERGRCRFAGWELDRRTRRLIDPDGRPVMLTKGEYVLLTVFVDAPQRPLSREHIMRASRVHEDVFDRSIDVQVLRLRRKLEIDSSTPQIIRTERGLGYIFTPLVERL
jgi:DNA-binding response OmpR family regulator